VEERVPRRIDAGEVLAAVGGVLVFVSLYLTWFDVARVTDASGFEAFETLDLLLAVLAIAAVWSAVASTLALDSAPPARLLPLLGLAIVLIVGVQIIDPPPVFSQVDPDREIGAWLALSGGALVLLGGALRSARISVTVSVGGRDVRRRVAAVDRRPAATSPTPPPPPPPPAAEADPDATQPFTPAEER
jgi:hypothetical protein